MPNPQYVGRDRGAQVTYVSNVDRMIGMESAKVTALLSAEGLESPEISEIGDQEREPIFRVRAGNDRYFAKVLTQEKARRTERVLESGINVGLPESQLLENGVTVLLMEPAVGWPFSRQFLTLLPGVWRLLTSSFQTAFHRVGEYLGRLHTETANGSIRVADSDRLERVLTIHDEVTAAFDKRILDRLQEHIDEAREVRVPRTLVHGDVTPHNVYVAPRSGAVDLIDFSLAESVAVEDHMVAECGIELFIERLPYGRTSQTAALRTAFREGYTATGPDVDVPKSVVETLKTARYCTMFRDYRAPDRLTGTRARLTRLTDERVITSKIRSF